ncbi:unnamed protein product [Malus baccata var. baccata]
MSMERSGETRRPTMAASKSQKRIMREQSKKQRRYRRGDQDQDSTEESLGFSDHQAPPPLKAAREVIGVAVPRKARSAAGKRSHENFSSESYGGVGEEEQSLQQLSFKAASLSFSNVSSRKTMKRNGPKIRIPKSSAPVEEEDIEIEIAEVLYGLMKQTQNSKTSKFETEDRNDSEEKKAEDGSASMAVQSSSAGEGVEVEESDQPEKIEACSDGASGSMDSHEEKAENPCVEEKSIIATKAEFSCEDSEGTKAISTGLEHKRKREGERFEIDLMAPPPMDQDDDFTDSVSDPKPPTQDVDMKIEVLVKKEEKVEIFPKEVVVEKLEEKKQNENPNQDSSSKSTTRLQPSDSLLPQLPRKRCATHRHIAHNIHLHQKVARANNFWPAATGSVPQCGTKPDIPLLGSFSGPNLQHSQKKKQAAPKFSSDSGKDRSSEAGNVIETSHKLQLSVQQTPQPAYAGNQMHGHTFALPRVEHQAAVAPTSSKSVVLKFAQSTNNAALSSHLAARPLESSSVNFNGYQYPISAHIQTTPVFGGGNPAQALPLINAPFISNQMFHPSYVQQHQVQPSHQNANASSPSHRQHESHKPRETQFSSNNCFTSQKQRVSPGETNMENAASPAASHVQNSVYGQNFSVPFQPVNFTLMPYVTMGGGGGGSGSGNQVEQSHKQGLKGGVELIPSNAYGMSFSSVTGNNGSGSCLNFSSMAQNPAIFQRVPDMAQQGYKITPAPQAGHQKNHHHQISQRKTDGGSKNADDGLRAASGKSSSGIVQRQTLVFDNPSRTLNFMSSSSQQQNLFQFQLQNPHLLQKQQPAVAAKVPKSAPVSSKALMQCNSHHQSSQLKNSTVMTCSLQQRRGSQGQTQISFGGNPKSASAPQGQKRLTNHHSSSISALQSQQTENSSLSGNGPISSPACGRNLASILSTCPSHISELKF